MVLQNNPDPEWGTKPDTSRDRLYTDLRENFTRTASGGDCMRTASVINANLQALGICEWMEAYSCDGQRWSLKRMEWKPGADGRTEIHQHLQRQYHDINFGEALYYLDHYEQAQRALGFLPDAEDRGQCTGVPLFLDVAADEGIACDIHGRLVIPYKGHLLGSGVFPVEAFQIAAQGRTPERPVSQALVTTGSASSSDSPYTLSDNMRKNLQNAGSHLNSKIAGIQSEKGKFLDNAKIVFGYKSCYHEKHFDGFSTLYYLQKNEAINTIPKELAAVFYCYAYLAELILSRVIAADIMKLSESSSSDRSSLIFAEALKVCQVRKDWLGSKIDENEFSLSRLALESLSPDVEFQKVKGIIESFDDMARSVSLDLSSFRKAPAPQPQPSRG